MTELKIDTNLHFTKLIELLETIKKKLSLFNKEEREASESFDAFMQLYTKNGSALKGIMLSRFRNYFKKHTGEILSDEDWLATNEEKKKNKNILYLVPNDESAKIYRIQFSTFCNKIREISEIFISNGVTGDNDEHKLDLYFKKWFLGTMIKFAATDLAINTIKNIYIDVLIKLGEYKREEKLDFMQLLKNPMEFLSKINIKNILPLVKQLLSAAKSSGFSVPSKVMEIIESPEMVSENINKIKAGDFAILFETYNDMIIGDHKSLKKIREIRNTMLEKGFVNVLSNPGDYKKVVMELGNVLTFIPPKLVEVGADLSSKYVIPAIEKNPELPEKIQKIIDVLCIGKPLKPGDISADLMWFAPNDTPSIPDEEFSDSDEEATSSK